MAFDRVIFVVGPGGDLGPFRVEELDELLQQGEIASSDQIRTAFGARLGTVDDVVSGRVRVGSHVVATTTGDESRSDESGSRARRRALVIPLVVVSALLALGWFLLRQPAPVALPLSEVELPVVTLTRVEDTAQGAVVRVTIDRRMDHPVSVRTTLHGDEQALSLQPADGVVTIAPGESFAPLSLKRRGDAYRAHTVEVTVEPGASFITGAQAGLAVELPAAPRPSIAWESFAPVGAEPSAASGWETAAWVPDEALLRARDPLAIVGMTTPPYHGLLLSKNPQWSPTYRQLTQTVSEGTVWISFMMEAVCLANQSLPWLAVNLKQDSRYTLTVGFWNPALKPGMMVQLVSHGPSRAEDLIHAQPHPQRSARIVIRFDLAASGGSGLTWVDPPGHLEPQADASLVQLRDLPARSFNVVELSASDGGSLRIADLRIGRTWPEVMPCE